MRRSWLLAMLLATDAAAMQLPNAVAGRVLRGRDAVAGALVQFIPVGGQTMALARDTVVIDQVHLRFDPDIVHVLPGTTIDFRNSDPIMHNVFSPSRGGAGFNLGTYPRSESRYHTFAQPGRYLILCHVHPEMVAWVMVVQTPYVATTDERGAFEINEIPSGDYTVVTWYRNRLAQDTTVTLTDLRASELVLTIKDE